MRMFPILAAAALTAAGHAQTYTLTELTPPPGMTGGGPQDITEDGRALIIYEDSAGGTRTVIWQNGVPTDIGVFQGLGRTEGNSLSESGVVIGSSWSSTGFPAVAWRWQNGVFTSLGNIGGYANGGGGNEAGHATGWAMTSTSIFTASTQVFFHDGTVMKSLGNTASGDYSDGSGINALDQVVGSFISRRRVSLAGSHFGDPAGGLHELPTLGGLEGHANAINDAGQVVGSSDTGAIGPNSRYLRHAFVWADGVTKDLGTLPGDTESVAIGLNNAGDIVGDSFSDSFTIATFKAVLWPQGGTAVDLNTRIPAGSGVQLTFANAINGSGHVLASGLPTGQTQTLPYLLTPVP